jgi:adenosylcobinamide kinase/adenosylcobinamide-phosphate guanylyltransferase
MSTVTLVTGGGRSGKSRYALAMATAATVVRPAFVATAEVTDDEMAERVRRHQAERDGRFVNVEEPVQLAEALRGLPADVDLAIVDCLTVWLGNLYHHGHVDADGSSAPIEALLEVLREAPCDLVLVTNEVGMGIIPADAMSRAYRDRAGILNQQVAAVADRVVLVVAGLPMVLKA